jgi:hypothetical protein
VDVCFAHDNWYSVTVPFTIPTAKAVPHSIFELKVLEPTWLYISLCQPTKRGKANVAYYYSDITLVIFKITVFDGKESISLEDIRYYGPSKVSHVELVLGDSFTSSEDGCRYLLCPISVERSVALAEEERSSSKKPNAGLLMVGAGGSVKKGKGSPECEFSMRIFSANPVLLRERDLAQQDVLWDAMERSLCESGIVGSKMAGSPIVVSSLRHYTVAIMN